MVKIVEHELNTEANELINAAINPPATRPFSPTGNNVLTSIGKALSAFSTLKTSGFCTDSAKAIIPGIRKIKIGKAVWIGQNVIIKQGVKIGTGSVIGMGSVVTKDVAPYTIVAGIPAKQIRMRFENNIINSLLSSKWWELEEKKLKEMAKYIRRPEEFIKNLTKLEKNE